MKAIKFPKEIEEVYRNVFQPLNLQRSKFKKIVSVEICAIGQLTEGEVYAMQNVTKADKLSLLVSGTAEVTSKRRDCNQERIVIPKYTVILYTIIICI